jgi:hypothetical protein
MPDREVEKRHKVTEERTFKFHDAPATVIHTEDNLWCLDQVAFAVSYLGVTTDWDGARIPPKYYPHCPQIRMRLKGQERGSIRVGVNMEHFSEWQKNLRSRTNYASFQEKIALLEEFPKAFENFLATGADWMSTPPVAEVPPSSAIATAADPRAFLLPVQAMGYELECTEVNGEGYVSVESLCRPFSKRVDHQIDRMQTEGIYDLRLVEFRDGRARWCMHEAQVEMAVMRFDITGMDPVVLDKWRAFAKEAGLVVHTYFKGEIAVNRRFSDEHILNRLGTVEEFVRNNPGVTPQALQETVTVAVEKAMEKVIQQSGIDLLNGSAVVTAVDLKDHKSSAWILAIYGKEKEPTSLKVLAVHLKLIGDQKYGDWNQLTEQTVGRTARHNWVWNPTLGIPTIQDAYKRFLDHWDENVEAGVDNAKQFALEQTMVELPPLGTGAHTWLMRDHTHPLPQNVIDFRRQRRPNRP